MYIRISDFRKAEDIGKWPVTKMLEERVANGCIDALLYREIRLLPEESMRRIKLEIESRIRGLEAELHICENQRTVLQSLHFNMNQWRDPAMEYWGRPIKERFLVVRRECLLQLHAFIELEQATRERIPTAEELSDWLQESCTPRSQMALLLLNEHPMEKLESIASFLRERASQLEHELREHTDLESDEVSVLTMQGNHLLQTISIVEEEMERDLRPKEIDDDEGLTEEEETDAE